MNLLGGLLELPGKMISQGLKALTGPGEEKKEPVRSHLRDQMHLSDELSESISPVNIGNANDLDSLQTPLAGAYGMHQNRYDYNPQGCRVAKLFEAQMTDFSSVQLG